MLATILCIISKIVREKKEITFQESYLIKTTCYVKLNIAKEVCIISILSLFTFDHVKSQTSKGLERQEYHSSAICIQYHRS